MPRVRWTPEEGSSGWFVPSRQISIANWCLRWRLQMTKATSRTNSKRNCCHVSSSDTSSKMHSEMLAPTMENCLFRAKPRCCIENVLPSKVAVLFGSPPTMGSKSGGRPVHHFSHPFQSKSLPRDPAVGPVLHREAKFPQPSARSAFPGQQPQFLRWSITEHGSRSLQGAPFGGAYRGSLIYCSGLNTSEGT